MNKVKIWTLAVLAVLSLAGCVKEDNSIYDRLHTYNQTEAFSAAEGTHTVTLEHVTGLAVVGSVDADWVTITPLTNNGTEPTQVEVTVQANDSDAERTTTADITVGDYIVKLTVSQGVTNVDDPNEEVTDQPAYTPGK